MKQIIIIADDFGLAKGINLGIIKAHAEGMVTSTGVVVNGDFFEHGLSLIKKTSLDTGIHLNLTSGKPLLKRNDCKTLTDRNGMFFRYPSLVRKILLKKIDPSEIKRELRAQIERFLKSGLFCSHINSHKHIGLFPPIIDIIIELAKEFRIKKMRCPIDTGISGERLHLRDFLSKDAVRNSLVSFLAKKARQKLDEKKIGYPGHFFDISKRCKGAENPFPYVLQSLEEGTSEIMCHPSLMEEDSAVGYGRYEPKRRCTELKMLLDPELKESIRRMNIKIVSFKDIDFS